MKDSKNRIAYLDGGTVVDIESKDNRLFITFKHAHKEGIFKLEIDECVLNSKKDPSEELQALLRIHDLIGELSSVFDRMRDNGTI
jgi:hypothetical protein